MLPGQHQLAYPARKREVMRRLLLAATLLAFPTWAQTPFRATRKATNPNALAFSAHHYNQNGASKANSARPNAEVGRAQAAEAGVVHGIQPDTLKVPADGADDAPSIQRAITAACGTAFPNVVFQARHYALNSTVTQSCAVNWIGQGWREQNPVPAAAPGTWFDIGPAFIGTAGSPITITRDSTGSTLRGIGFTEPGQPSRPTPIMSGSIVTGWAPATWTPAAYAPVLTINGAPGVTVRDVMLLGVNAGMVCAGSGRCDFENIRGQVFAYALNIQTAYDVSRIRDVHAWPYWSAADPVMQWQQANASVIISYRNDTPMWSHLFVFGAKDGVLIAGEPAGSTTGLMVDMLSCDFTQTCIRVDATAGLATYQISNLRSYGQVWNTVAGAPITMLPDSSVASFDGQAVAQIGNAESYGTDTAVLRFLATTATGASTLHLNSLYTHAERMSTGAVIASFPSGGSNAATINGSLVTGTPPAGFALTNTGIGQPGIGTLFMPTLATVH